MAKLTALTALSPVVGSDISYFVSNPGGTPLSRKGTIDTLFTNRLITTPTMVGPDLGTALVKFGGSTASFPGLKRDVTVLGVRLGDDSGYATLAAANVVTTGTVHASLFFGSDDSVRLANGLGVALNNATRIYFGTGASAGGSYDLSLQRNGIGALKIGDGSSGYGKLELAGSVYDLAGAGSPEGVVTANPGSLYRNTTGGAGVTLYIKESGTSNTGWIAYITGAGSGLVDPMTTIGDIIVRNASNVSARLAIGAANRYLSSDGTNVSWGQVSLSAGVTGTLADGSLSSNVVLENAVNVFSTSNTFQSFVEFTGITTPAVPAAGSGRIYFDTALDGWKIMNSSAPFGLPVLYGSGVANVVAFWDSTSSLGSAAITIDNPASTGMTIPGLLKLGSTPVTINDAAGKILSAALNDVAFANLVPATAASVLIGRGSAGGAGDFQEVTLGAGLTMTGTVLSASGGGSGDVVGPASAVNNRVVFFDGTTGKLIKDSGLTLSGSNTGDQTSVTGNAGTATALQTGRNINGVVFDGDENITVTAAAGTLSGATLAAGVTASSLTSFGSTPTIVTPSITTGFTIGGVAATGTIPRGNGTNFVASAYTMAAPGTSGNVLTSDGTNWLSSTPAGGGGSNPFDDATAIIKGSADATKLLRFEVDGFTTGTTRVLTPPNANGIIAVLGLAQTFTENQTIQPTADGTSVFNVKASSGNHAVQIGTYPSVPSYAGIWFGNVTPNGSNYGFIGNGTETILNSPSSLVFRINHAAGPSAVVIDTNITLGLPLLAGNITTTATSSTGTAVILDGSNVLRPLTSSLRFKTNVREWHPSEEAMSRFLALDPIRWDYRENEVKDVVGFSAEGLADVSPELVNFDSEGKPYSNREHAIFAFMHEILRKQQAQITRLEQRAR